MRGRVLILAALLLATGLAAQEPGAAYKLDKVAIRLDGQAGGASSSYATMTAPTGCATTELAYFLGSPATLTCLDATYTAATKTLAVPQGAVTAANFTATGLATPGSITVTPTLSQIGAITVVAGASLVDGDALSVGDGTGIVPIEFDASPGDGTTGGAVPIIFDGTETATEIRDAVRVILNGAGRDWTTSAQGADGIGIVRATPGATGGAITEAVGAAGFLVTNWTNPTAATTYTYRLVARLAGGTTTEAGATSTTAAGVATLSASNYNALSWSAVTGAASYDVYRTVGAPTGIIYTGTALAVNDTGLAGGGGTAPTVDGTGVVTADRVLVGDGTEAAPSLALASNPASGMYYRSATPQSLSLAASGTESVRLTATSLTLPGTTRTLLFGATGDLVLSRPAVATLQLGAAASATPVAQTLQAQGATGTDIPGANLTIQSGAGTSDATGSSLIFRTPTDTGSTGAVAQTQATRLTINQLGITPATNWRMPFGAIYWSAGSAAANEPNTPIKIAGTTAALGTNYEVTQATTNRLTYTGTVTRNFLVQATFSVDCSAATSLVMHLYRGGAAITGASISRTVGGTDIGAMAIHAIVSLATNEYVELWSETNDGDNVNVPYGQLSIHALD